MPRPRFATADAQIRQRILDAARKAFAKHGYAEASLNRILLEAGLSKGAYYYYFDDKLDLAAMVFAEDAKDTEASVSEMRMPATGEDFWAELRRVTGVRLELMTRDRTRYESLMRLSNEVIKNPKLMAAVLPHLAGDRQKIAEFFALGQKLGAVRSDLPVPLMLQLMEGVKTSAYRALFPEDRVLTQAELESFTDLMLDFGKRLLSPTETP